MLFPGVEVEPMRGVRVSARIEGDGVVSPSRGAFMPHLYGMDALFAPLRQVQSKLEHAVGIHCFGHAPEKSNTFVGPCVVLLSTCICTGNMENGKPTTTDR
jgi:hypothetical protein